MTYYTILKTKKIGALFLLANDTDLIGAYYLDSKRVPKIKKDWAHMPRQSILAQAAEQIKEYLGGTRKTFSIPIHFDGTEFQERIWTYTAKIPYGETLSYSELAKKAGVPAAVRATGSALAKNQIDIIVPAHRVIAKGGGTGGYTGKSNRKVNLLELEKLRRIEAGMAK